MSLPDRRPRLRQLAAPGRRIASATALTSLVAVSVLSPGAVDRPATGSGGEQDLVPASTEVEPRIQSLWVGRSRGVEVRVSGESGETELRGMRIELIDAGEGSVPQLMASETTDLANLPRIITRQQWGADESLSDACWEPIHAEAVQAAFLHHTAGSNSYSEYSSAAVVRGVYAYHTQSRGWCDIGHNVLVDRYGNIFEGRDGGIRKPVRGAHAGQVNSGTTGVSLMGTSSTRARRSPCATRWCA